MNKDEYLEHIEDSIEHKFATSKYEFASLESYIPYYDAFNKVGKRLFHGDWTNREFFARRGNTDIEEYKVAHKKHYKLFRNSDEELEIASRIGAAEYPIITNLQNGVLQAFYINHYTGALKAINEQFWRSEEHKRIKLTGRMRPQEKLDPRILPGLDFVVVIRKEEFDEVFKKLPKNNKSKAKLRPTNKAIKQYLDFLEKECIRQESVLDRKIFYDALNLLSASNFFTDGNSRPDWENFPSQYKSKRGYKFPKYVDIKKMKP